MPTSPASPAPSAAPARKAKAPAAAKPVVEKNKTPQSVSTKPPAKAAKAAKSPKVVKATQAAATKAKPVAEEKPKKVKLVRDSFTMPKNEYLQIEDLKMALAKQGRPAKKSELLRAGLMLLSKQTPGALLACVQALATVKTGRPKKD